MFYNLKDFAFTKLKQQLSSDATSIVVDTTSAFTAPAVILVCDSRSFEDQVNGEIMILETTTPSPGQSYVVTRGVDGTLQRLHSRGSYVLGNIFARHFSQIYENYKLISTFLARSFGVIGYGIVRTSAPSNTTDLGVSSGGAFSATISTGYGFIKDSDYSYPIELSLPYTLNGTSGIITRPLTGSTTFSIYLRKDGQIICTESTYPTPAGSFLPIARITVLSTAINLSNIILSNSGGTFTDDRVFF